MKNNLNKKRKNNNPRYEIITLLDPTCYAAEAYRRTKVCIDTFAIEKDLKVIQITSAMPGDGKTTTLLNVAISYAESQKKVLIIDLDLRKPKLHRAFRSENLSGITDYLMGNVNLPGEFIKHSQYNNVDFICAGPSPVRPTSLLSLNKLADLVNSLRETYDIILIDQPPVLVASDCCIVSRFCDGALFQISQRNTDKNAAKEAIAILKQNDVNVLGCVFTEVDQDSDSYTNKYKYKYKY